jgi:hypothetical protein
MSITNHQEAVMSNSIPAQHPAVVLRSQYRQLRALLAVLVVAVVGLSTTVVVLTVDDSETTTATSSVSRSYPTLNDPFQSRTDQPRTQSRPDESAVAAAIASQPPIVGPDESKIAAAIGSQPTPVSGPDESTIAAAIAEHSDTGPNARARAWQEKLDSMTPKQRAQVFGSGY